MNPRHNIIKFSDSYRNAKQRHTILLPVMMVSVVLGAFFIVALSRPETGRGTIYDYREAKTSVGSRFTSRQPEETVTSSRPSERVTISPPAPEIDLDFISPGLPSLESIDQSVSNINPASLQKPPKIVVPKARVIEPAQPTVTSIAKPVRSRSTPAATSPPQETQALNRFTPWMTKQEMNQLIIRLNEGHAESFWQRGHWITAVEGTWNGSEPEYRIVFEKSPKDRIISWRYRIDKPKVEFTEIMVQMGREGFDLVQSQFYEMPDGSRQYQGVWQKQR